jgi:ligand-binding sensor domain-containing protein
MKKNLALLFVLVSSSVFSQQAGDWQVYSSMRNINKIVVTGNSLWGATTGGVFRFTQTDSSYKKLTKVDGMQGIIITSAASDKQGNVWFGSSNGALDFYNSQSNRVGSIIDILNSNNNNKQINSLATSGDTIVAATDLGITLIDPINQVLFDTYFKFDYLTSNSKINYAVKYDLIYAASNYGVIIQKEGATNLSAPESWTVYTKLNGLPSNNISQVIKYNNSIIASSDLGLSIFDGSVFANYIPELKGKNINNLLVNGDSLFILANNLNLYLYTGGNLTLVYTFTSPVNNILVDPQFGILGSGSNGIEQVKNELVTNIFPNGPLTNLFYDISVNNDGTLWVGSGTDVTGVGFFALRNGYWTNYNTSNTPILPVNSYFSVFNTPDNTTYLGSWGRGFVRIKNDIITVFSKNTTGMLGIPTDTNYLVITGFAKDSKGSLWILNYGSADRKNLTMLTKDSVYYHFLIPATSNQDLRVQSNLVIDQYDTKWFISKDGVRQGLIYFNENNTVNNPADDISAFVGNLNSNIVNTCVVDKLGDVWVGTSLGVNVITNTYSITSSSNPQLQISSVFILRQQNINCILVDPLNQKWVGTNQGLFLVNPDGSNLMAVFDLRNSPLLSDVIQSLAINENTGTVYVVTDKGLVSVKTSSVKPKESFSGLQVFPSPFKLKNGSNQLTIDGLIADTDIKIISISGKLVRQFSSPGGRVAFWDGRDDGGNLVSSGIYIIVAYDKEGNNIAAGKVAVLRE